MTVFLDFLIHPNVLQLKGQISPLARKLQEFYLIPLYNP